MTVRRSRRRHGERCSVVISHFLQRQQQNFDTDALLRRVPGGVWPFFCSVRAGCLARRRHARESND